jgi:drug/metabolite transporter (DMT)-like permease
MGFGAPLLLTTGLIVEGLGRLDTRQWLVIIWLAVVNTALAWSLWNRSLRILSAVESSVLSGLMLPQTVLLAYIFLGENPSLIQIGGLIFVGLGTIIVQYRRNKVSVGQNSESALEESLQDMSKSQ